MVTTRDTELAARMAMLRSHGITRDPSRFVQHPADGATSYGGWYYEQQLLGFNYRLTDIQAALGTSQMTALAANIDRRNALARRYDQAFDDLPVEVQAILPENRSAYHLYLIRVPEGGAHGHRRMFDGLRAAGIGVNLHYMPIHLQPYYRGLGFRPGMFPEAERHGATAITLPMYAALSDADQEHVIASVRRLVRER
jgi:dTDP-4-amino-4,6-dideoxygalactose transaminase